MEGGSLFNPGFLGGHFLWWVGQIADDSTWRDNILAGKFENKDSIPGWGRRYKVRIIGLHDQGENDIPSDQLPWAQVMYPVTGGGGQANAGQTANLRQGMMVFGFFMDGQDQQVPVIMGVLGNNAQTELSTKTGDNKVTNSTPGSLATSGYADGKKPKQGTAQEKVPDDGLVTSKPKSSEQSKECAPIPSGVQTNAYGLRSDLSLTSQQFADAQSARAEAEQKGLTGADRDNLVQQRVADGIKNRCQQANNPNSPAQPGATKENVDAVHQQSVADIKRSEKYKEKIIMMKPDPDEVVNSAIKAMQTAIDNLVQKVDKYLSSISCYVDAVSNTISDIKKYIRDVACLIAKYMKILLDKLMEYLLKLLNKEMTNIVASMPSSMRYMFADIKERIIELITELYSKLTSGLCDLISGILNDALGIDDLINTARANVNSGSDTQRLKPQVSICYAEDVAGQVISANQNAINEFNQTIFDNVNTFLDDIDKQVAGVGGALADIKNQLGSISGNITSALNFTNIKLNIFGFEVTPEKAVSDFYQLATGGSGQPQPQLPSAKSVADSSVQPTTATSVPGVPYAEPSKDQADVKYNADASSPEQIASRTSGVA